MASGVRPAWKAFRRKTVQQVQPQQTILSGAELAILYTRYVTSLRKEQYKNNAGRR